MAHRRYGFEILFEFEINGGGGTSLWVRRGCAPVLGSFWPENSGTGVSFYWKTILAARFRPLSNQSYQSNWIVDVHYVMTHNKQGQNIQRRYNYAALEYRINKG